MYSETDKLVFGKGGVVVPLLEHLPSGASDNADIGRSLNASSGGTDTEITDLGVADDGDASVELPHDYKKKLGIEEVEKGMPKPASRDKVFDEHRRLIAELYDFEAEKNQERHMIAESADIREEDFPFSVDESFQDESFIQQAKQALSAVDAPDGLLRRLEHYEGLVTKLGVLKREAESFETNKVKPFFATRDTESRKIASIEEIAKARKRAREAYEQAEHAEFSDAAPEQRHRLLTEVKGCVADLRQLITFHGMIETVDDEAARDRVIRRRKEMIVLEKFIIDQGLLGKFHKLAELVSAEAGKDEPPISVMYRRIEASAKITQLKDQVELFMKEHCPIRMEEFVAGSVMEEDIRLQQKAREKYVKEKDPEIDELSRRAEEAIKAKDSRAIEVSMSRFQERVEAIEQDTKKIYPLAYATGESADVKGATLGHKVLQFIRDLATPGSKKE